ncbi:MAG: hypothetical protein RML72_02760, partial [Bacteroidia bacterium]|nr:hypothetical protein [Bacteroidia bacterium]MDW8157781.1 hypothetical protein [Bacteroidia bacterium]
MRLFAGLCHAFLFFLLAINVKAQIYPLSLEERINRAEFIIEGRVIRKESFWNENRTAIFTANEILVYKSYKGTVNGETAILMTQGGKVGNLLIKVSNALELPLGAEGIFLATVWPEPSTPLGDKNLMYAYAAEQSFIALNYNANTGRDPFNTFRDIAQLQNRISSLVGRPYNIHKDPFVFEDETPKNKIRGMAAPMITSYAPPGGSFAGGGQAMTIFGSGFCNGNNPCLGQPTVQFPNPNDGGATLITIPPGNINVWTDGIISFTIPTEVASANGATNHIIVTQSAADGGLSNTTSPPFTIHYNLINTGLGNNIRPALVNTNGIGGYTIRYNANFASNTPRVQAFERALETWRCATLVKFDVDCQTTSLTCNAPDENNLVAMDPGNCTPAAVAAGAIAQTHLYFATCNGTDYYLDEFDIMFSNTPHGGTWNYGPAATGAGQTDFESSALHQLGRAHLLGAVINTNAA